MMAFEDLYSRRLVRWRQTPGNHVTSSDEGAGTIEQLGIVTLYPVSPEVPNLFHAYTGDPASKPQSEWDSPAGEVYGWRWSLGRREAAFYSSVVRSRPTLVRWSLLSAVLCLRAEMRTADELFDLGELSANAYRIVQALEGSGGVLATGELRRQAGFPTGKEQRAAYLKAVDELDSRLMLAKVFSSESDDMGHALVHLRYPDYWAAGEQLSETEALAALLQAYLPDAVYALPVPLAKHLKLSETGLRAALDRLVESGRAQPAEISGQTGVCYLWSG